MVTENKTKETILEEEIIRLKANQERFERMLQAMKSEIYVIRSKTGV